MGPAHSNAYVGSTVHLKFYIESVGAYPGYERGDAGVFAVTEEDPAHVTPESTWRSMGRMHHGTHGPDIATSNTIANSWVDIDMTAVVHQSFSNGHDFAVCIEHRSPENFMSMPSTY